MIARLRQQTNTRTDRDERIGNGCSYLTAVLLPPGEGAAPTISAHQCVFAISNASLVSRRPGRYLTNQCRTHSWGVTQYLMLIS